MRSCSHQCLSLPVFNTNLKQINPNNVVWAQFITAAPVIIVMNFNFQCGLYHTPPSARRNITLQHKSNTWLLNLECRCASSLILHKYFKSCCKFSHSFWATIITKSLQDCTWTECCALLINYCCKKERIKMWVQHKWPQTQMNQLKNFFPPLFITGAE